MIILTTAQKDSFLNLKKDFQSVLDKRHVDIVPIEAKSGKWIIPDEVLTDENHKELHDELKKYTKRVILESELIANKL